MAISAENTTTPFPTSGTTGTAESGLMEGTVPMSSSGTATGARSVDVMNRVVQGAHQTIDRLAERAEPLVQKLSENVTGANENLRVRADHLREVGDEWAESLRTTVRDNPIAAVATALAVGMLISRLTR